MKPSPKKSTAAFFDEFSWAQPLDLQASLRIRDGLAESPRVRIPGHVLQTIRARAARDPNLCLN